ncbi:MAG: hypothetical protein SCL54_14990 [Bacillota bacterium]|nr:hypothetical protein [Bacillota bacterium]
MKIMMSLEKLNDYIERLGITNVQIAKFYIKDDGKAVSRQFIGQIRNGQDDMGQDAYKKFIKAVNAAQQERRLQIINKTMDSLSVPEIE